MNTLDLNPRGAATATDTNTAADLDPDVAEQDAGLGQLQGTGKSVPVT